MSGPPEGGLNGRRAQARWLCLCRVASVAAVITGACSADHRLLRTGETASGGSPGDDAMEGGVPADAQSANAAGDSAVFGGASNLAGNSGNAAGADDAEGGSSPAGGAAPQNVLSVVVAGTGRVSSDPPGLSACVGACTHAFPQGQLVTLDATPGTGYDFQGWSGDCSGTDPSASVALTAPRACTATFTGQWARWPMPNPAGSGLPNPAVYDTSASGVVLDSTTGLMWQRTLDGNLYSWSEAQAYCRSLAVGGFSDWRLPSRVELFSIFDFTKADVDIDLGAFPGTTGDFFWSTSSAPGGTSFFFVHSRIGIGALIPSQMIRVRCMRVAGAPASITAGDTPPTRYMVQNGTVYDRKTSLTWQQALEPAAGGVASYLWADAQAHCTALALNGGGWRLPSVKELVTLVDETRSAPAIDTDSFPDTPNTKDAQFWSSSSDANSGGHWFVLFYNALTQSTNNAVNYHARCVR